MAKPKSKWPRFVAMGLVAALLVGFLSLMLVEKFAPTQTLVPQSIVQMPSKIVAAAVKPLQGAFAWATGGVKGYLDSWKLRKNIEIEYNKLKSQNEELIYAALLNESLEADNERYKQLLGVYEANKEMNPIMATVIGRETGNWFRSFTIDKGSDHGIKEQMAVINADGLVGNIYKVNKTSSEVITIIDSRSSISGLIPSSRNQGTVRGTLGIEDEPGCRMYYLPVDLVPRPNDTVVTSGIGMPFPKGIGIGVVRESTRYMDENKHYFVIEPYVDFQHIEEVLVLIYDSPEEEMPVANDGQIDYVPGQLDAARPSPSIGMAISDPNLGAVTPPPRATRGPADGTPIEATGTDAPHTLEPGATPTPNPELDALMREELEAEGY